MAWVTARRSPPSSGFLSFTCLVAGQTVIPGSRFRRSALAKYRAEGKTVMVDFTADWCLTCKTNLKFAINTEDVSQWPATNGVVPLLADFRTEDSPEIKQMLAALESNSIPLLAIFPADRPDEAIVLRRSDDEGPGAGGPEGGRAVAIGGSEGQGSGGRGQESVEGFRVRGSVRRSQGSIVAVCVSVGSDNSRRLASGIVGRTGEYCLLSLEIAFSRRNWRVLSLAELASCERSRAVLV